jgi:Beta-1,3-glucanase
MYSGFRKLKFAVGLVLFAAAFVLAAGPEPLQAATPKVRLVPLQIVNNSGFSGDLWVYVFGQSGSKYYTVKNAAGALKPMKNSKGKYLPLGVNMGQGTTVNLKIPQLSATRVYVLLGKPAYIQIPKKGMPTVPIGWTSTDPNFNTIFDWFEYTWANSGPKPLVTALNTNATQVDMLGLPLLVQLKGVNAGNASTTTLAGFQSTTARPDIVSAINAAGAPWSNLVIPGPSGSPALRVIAPYHGMTYVPASKKNPVFPANQLQPYIKAVFIDYMRKPMLAPVNVAGSIGLFTGHVAGGKLVFTRKNEGGGTVAFDMPNSAQVYQGYLGTPSKLTNPNAQASLNAQALVLANFLQAGFLRSTIAVNQHLTSCPSPTTYYKNAPVDIYAKVMHEYAYQNLAYAFGWDDTCNQSSDNTVYNPTQVQITILPLSN